MAENGNWVDKVLAFWFGELTLDDWFSADERLDARIRTRFELLYKQLAERLPPETETDPRANLAAIIVFDQFPRNMYRHQAAAFATDDLAMKLARIAVEKRFDEALTAEQRQFLYMPFMHSERLADQERGVDLFRRLGNAEAIRYAEEHRDIIARFGRFPHRNRVLGRESTADERAFLISHEGFGQ
jgi:uncharacterized protein (DUF924 family)